MTVAAVNKNVKFEVVDGELERREEKKKWNEMNRNCNTMDGFVSVLVGWSVGCGWDFQLNLLNEIKLTK